MLPLCLLLASQDPSAIADRLRSDRIEEREQGTRDLLKLGRKAPSAAEALLSDPVPEVVLRARQILRELVHEGSREARRRLEVALSGATSVHLRFKTLDPRTGRTVPGEVWVKGDRIRGRIGAGTGLAILQILSERASRPGVALHDRSGGIRGHRRAGAGPADRPLPVRRATQPAGEGDEGDPGRWAPGRGVPAPARSSAPPPGRGPRRRPVPRSHARGSGLADEAGALVGP